MKKLLKLLGFSGINYSESYQDGVTLVTFGFGKCPIIKSDGTIKAILLENDKFFIREVGANVYAGVPSLEITFDEAIGIWDVYENYLSEKERELFIMNINLL